MTVNPANRKVIISGGFPYDSDRSDIEEALRNIMNKYEGVERVSIMCRYGSFGKGVSPQSGCHVGVYHGQQGHEA